MKILFIMTRKMYPVSDGGQRCVYGHFSVFDTENDKIFGIMANVDDKCDDWKEFFPMFKDMLIFQRCHHKVRTNPFVAIGEWLSSGKPRRAQVLVSEENKKKTMDYILKHGIDTVVLECPYGAEYLDFEILKKNRIRVVLIELNVEYIFQRESLKRFGFLAELEVYRTKKYEAEILPKVDCVITVSPKDAAIFRKQFNLKNVRFIPIPLEKNHKSWCKSPSNYVLFNGSLNMYTNRYSMQWFVKEVFTKFHEKFPDIKLKITGNVDNNIKKQFDFEGIEFTGFLTDGELEKMLMGCMFAVSPIIIGSGIKLKLLEGLSYGIPIIATEHCFEGAPYDVNEEKPYIVAHGSLDFYKQMVYLVESEEYREVLGANAKSFFNAVYASDENRQEWRKVLLGS